jgi:hypothetical protein
LDDWTIGRLDDWTICRFGDVDLGFEFCVLEFVWNLEFGAWNLPVIRCLLIGFFLLRPGIFPEKPD